MPSSCGMAIASPVPVITDTCGAKHRSGCGKAMHAMQWALPQCAGALGAVGLLWSGHEVAEAAAGSIADASCPVIATGMSNRLTASRIEANSRITLCALARQG